MTKIIDLQTKQIYDISPSRQGENKIICPKCTPTRKNKRDKALQWNELKGTGQCYHCSTAFVRYDPYKNKTPERQYVIPEWKNQTKLTDKAVKWFTGRMISQQTLNECKIYSDTEWMPQYGKEVEVICFPYFRGGQLVNIKYRGPGKSFKMVSNAELIFWNYDSMVGAKEVAIVEGEIDALSLIEIGFKNVISVPNGASARELSYLDNCVDVLSTIDTIYLAVDQDEAGFGLRQELIRRLDSDRCKIVDFKGRKDANEVLCQQGGQALKACINNATMLPIRGEFNLLDHKDKIWDVFVNGHQSGKGLGIPALDEGLTWKTGQMFVFVGLTSHGKALDINTPIPTPSGWSIMNDIHVGDKVYDEKGNECYVIAETEVMYDRPCYEVFFSDHSSVICDEQHLWVTRDAKAMRSQQNANKNDLKRGDNVIKRTYQEYKRTYPTAKTTLDIFNTLKAKDGRNNHAIALSQPIVGNYLNVDLDPYTLGAWLGDGHSCGAIITNPDIEVLNGIEKGGHKLTKYKAPLAWGISNLHEYLKKYNLINNKHIPSLYLRLSIEQRRELLRGLMDTDGSILKDGNCEFTNTNIRIAEGVHDLIVGLGMKAQIRECRATLYGKDCGPNYRIAFAPNFDIFTIKRKKERIKKSYSPRLNWRTIIDCKKVESGPVKCIQVSSASSQYLCGKNMIPTHNSQIINFISVKMNVQNDWKVAYFSPENMPYEDYLYPQLASLLVGKTFNKQYMSEQEFNDTLYYVEDNFKFIDAGDDYTVETVINAARMMVKRYGIKVLVIDPFNCFEHKQQSNESETQYIGRFLDSIVRFAKKYDVLVLIATHPPKLQKLNGVRDKPDLYDINGSANFANKCDGGVTIYRKIDDLGNTIGTEFIKRKIRFKEQGELGIVDMFYNPMNGRYDFPTKDELGSKILKKDVSNWINSNSKGDSGFHIGDEDDNCPF